MEQINIKYGVASDIGLKRKNNEDSWLIKTQENDQNQKKSDKLFIVADGMGGGPAGEIASCLAVQEVQNHYYASNPQEKPWEAINTAVLAAHNRIRHEVFNKPQYAGMGTTVTALVLHDNLAYIAHVGDSRAYLIRKQKMIQLTNDQNISAAMMRRGEICPEDAQNHPQRNILTQSVGGRNLQPKVELIRTDIENEDKFLLCSDGLYSMLNDNEIMETICKHANLQSAAEALVKQANQKGGPDNITVMIIEI